MAKINPFHVSLFAEFLGKLKSTPEGNGSLLDHSLYLYDSGMGNPNVHAHRNLPILVAGGARLKSGKSGRGLLSRASAAPFLLAAVPDDAALMRLLVDLGGDPLRGNEHHCTPLMAAAGVGTIAPLEEAGSAQGSAARLGSGRPHQRGGQQR